MRGVRACAVAVLAAVTSLGCGTPKPVVALAEHTFHLEPLPTLVASPQLEWLVHATPRAMYASPALATALEELVDSSRIAAFTAAHGGLDPRALHEVVYARYEAKPGRAPGELWLGRGYVSGAVETAELKTLPYVRQHAREPSGLVRIEGRADNTTVDVLLFGHQGLARATAAAVPAKAARAFAEGRLKKVRPALSQGPLAELDRALGDGAVRIFGVRPDRAFARDGLFEHFEAVGLTIVPSERSGTSTLTVRIAAVGSFSDRERLVEAEVSKRLARIDASRVGALLALRQAPPWVFHTDARTLTAERIVQTAPFLRGLHLATGADTAELFANP